jgi:quercetin dioxygenase-like cupin family protein
MTELRPDPAVLRRAGPDRSRVYASNLMTFLLDAGTTEGRVSVVEALAQQGSEPPPHVHSREDEIFYLLDGRAEFTRGEETVEGGPGDLIFLPRGVPHGFRLLTPTGRALILLTPAGFEEAFKEFSEPATSLELPPLAPPADLGRMMSVFGEYGITFLGPPPGPPAAAGS